MLYFYIYLILNTFSVTINSPNEWEEVPGVVSNFDTIKVKTTVYYTAIFDVLNYGVGSGKFVTHKGKKIRLYLRPEAIKSISIEGFAILNCRTESLRGTYLINDSYEVQPYVLGSRANKLKVGDIAVDNQYIPFGTKFYIKELDKYCTAKDCGSAIKGERRIDFYIGELPYNVAVKKANSMPETLTLIVKKTTVRVKDEV
jgi:3D (Asp-Asp-Asp) domain-containing protein